MTFEAGTGAYVVDVLPITAAPPALVTEDKGRRVVALALVVVSPRSRQRKHAREACNTAH